MRKKNFFCRLAAFVLLAVCFLVNAETAHSEAMKVTVTSPWLFLLSSFIGGVNVTVVSLQEWNANGDLVRAPRARTAQALVPDARLMAFDVDDARLLGLSVEKRPNFSALYAPFPIKGMKIDAALSDPSVLPFIAQRVLTALADWDPANYPYYQRRLAEFQARLYSTILAGRQILKDQAIFDLTGYSTPLLQAAGCKLEFPASADLAAWSASKNLDLLKARVNQSAVDKIPVVIDLETPRAIRRLLAGRTEVFSLGRPALTQDYPSFLHDQYISLWLKLTSKPLAVPKRKN